MLSYEAAADIAAPIELVWSLITDGPGYLTWDSGVVALDGEIDEGARLAIRAATAPDRTFRVKVAFGVGAGLGRSMRWQGGMPIGLFTGTRLFQLTEPDGPGRTHLHVREQYTGPLAPLIGRSIPDLGPAFAGYVAGAKAEAERRAVA